MSSLAAATHGPGKGRKTAKQCAKAKIQHQTCQVFPSDIFRQAAVPLWRVCHCPSNNNQEEEKEEEKEEEEEEEKRRRGRRGRGRGRERGGTKEEEEKRFKQHFTTITRIADHGRLIQVTIIQAQAYPQTKSWSSGLCFKVASRRVPAFRPLSMSTRPPLKPPGLTSIKTQADDSLCCIAWVIAITIHLFGFHVVFQLCDFSNELYTFFLRHVSKRLTTNFASPRNS